MEAVQDGHERIELKGFIINGIVAMVEPNGNVPLRDGVMESSASIAKSCSIAGTSLGLGRHSDQSMGIIW